MKEWLMTPEAEMFFMNYQVLLYSIVLFFFTIIEGRARVAVEKGEYKIKIAFITMPILFWLKIAIPISVLWVVFHSFYIYHRYITNDTLIFLVIVFPVILIFCSMNVFQYIRYRALFKP